MEGDEDVELDSSHGDVTAVMEIVNSKANVNDYCLRTNDDGDTYFILFANLVCTSHATTSRRCVHTAIVLSCRIAFASFLLLSCRSH
jgi:hypothetical protein